jgi:hypothetical protein
MAAERESAHHAAHNTTMKMATAVAMLAMNKVNRTSSRCSVVIDDASAEESFAMRPL